MKFKTSNKAVRCGYHRVLSVGYCSLQRLLSHEAPVAYTAGVYGWNADVYEISTNTAIVTGYRPGSSKNMKDDYALVKEYEDKAYKLDPYTADVRAAKRALIEELLKKLEA